MVAIPQVQMPDFAGTLMRGEQFQQSRLQALAQQQALEDARREGDALRAAAPGLAAGTGPQYDSALASLLGAGPRGMTVALPLLQRRQDRREYEEWQRGGGLGGAPASGAAAPGDPLTRIAAVESGGDDNARNPRSSAAGRFQIIDSTWRQYAPRLGLTDAQRMDPAAQEQVARAIQADAQQAVGRPLTPGEQYGAHFLGIGGLRAFLSADPNADAQTVYAQAAGPQIAAQAFQRNPGLLAPGMTVGQVMQALGGRMGGSAPAGGDSIPAQAAVPGGAPSRTGIDPAELRRIEAGLASPNEMIRRAAQARLQALQFQMRDGTEQNPPPTVTLGEGPHGPAGVYQRNRDGSLTRLGDPPPPATQVNVNPGDTPRARADTTTLTEMQRSAGEARQIISIFDRAERAVRATPDGQGAQLLPIVGQTARALGIEIAGTEEAEVLRSLTNSMAVLQRAPGSGATTDFEMRLYMQAVPRLGNTRGGNLRLIEIGRRLAQRRIDEAAIWRRHAGEPDLMDRLNALPPVFTEDDQRFLSQDAVPVSSGPRVRSAPPQATVGGNPAEPPPPAAPRPRARNAQGQVLEYDGNAWVPAR